MMEAPTLSRFLLRSRMLWLTVFSLMFFSWAWWDSERYLTRILWFDKRYNLTFLESRDGGATVKFNFHYSSVSGKLHFEREPLSVHGPFIDLWGRPEYFYYELMIIVSGICALYLRWRWYLIRRESSAT